MIVCFGTAAREKRLTVSHPREVSQQVVVYPDEINVNGNLAIVTGHDQGSKQAETLFVKIDSLGQKQRLEKQTRETIWQVHGELEPIVPATNFNQFDNRQYQRTKKVYNQVNVDGWKMRRFEPSFSVKKGCHELRAYLKNYFLTMPQPISGYCQRLLIGENDRGTRPLMSDVKRLGIIHLFCISGMHVVLLTTALRRLLVYCYFDRQTIDLLLIILLPTYLIIGGGSVSLVRAIVMTEVGLIGRCFSFNGLDAWSISLIVGIMLDPYVLMSLGGQLTYLLSFLLQVLPKTLIGWRLAAVMNLVSLPSLFSFVYEIHLISFFASYIIIPVFSIAIFPAVLICAATYRLFPPLTNLTNSLLTVFHQVLASLAVMPGMIHFGKPSPILAMFIFLSLIWLVADLSSRRAWLIALCSILLSFLLIHFPLSGEVTFVDIGQGDCIIIRTPFNRSTVMIDTGGKLNFPCKAWQRRNVAADVAEKTSINYLKSIGISHLDAIYLSHHDTDHIGYLPSVLKNIKVDNVCVPAGMEKEQRLMRLVNQPTNIAFPKVVPVVSGAEFSKVGLTVLHPFQAGKAENTDSMVLIGCFGRQRFLFTGDLDKLGEQRLIHKYPELRVDVLKLGHHGSKTASSTKFLRTVRPQLGIISAGRFNRYGHPNNATMKRLKKCRIQTASTQQFGMIRYRYWSHRDVWETKLQGDELKWMLPPYDNS